MDLPEQIDSPLGPLARLAGSPDGCVFWHGSLSGIDFDVCAPGLPGEEQLMLVRRVLADRENLLRQARRHLACAIGRSPAEFGVSEAVAQEINGMADEDLPFDLPQLVFYEKGEWMIRFAEGRYLPAFDGNGVAVEFLDGGPVRVEDLSGADEL